MPIREISGLRRTYPCKGLSVRKKKEIRERSSVSNVRFKAVLILFPSCTLVKSSERRTRIKTAKIETFESAENFKIGARKRIPKTPNTTAQRINDILGKY
jgi:hypothetical protein